MAAVALDSEAVRRARYEYRVWGGQTKARKRLARLADRTVEQVVEDCYLLTDDATWNAKVRDDVLKLKRLAAEDRGFERWVTDRHRTAHDVPEPFEDIFEAMRLDRVARGKSFDLGEAVARLGPEHGVEVVFVTKHRVRHFFGELRADATDMEIEDTGVVLRSLCIEGHDLDALVALRDELGLEGEPNVAVHEAIESAR